jgi:Domain of unknown function (DUF4160)
VPTIFRVGPHRILFHSNEHDPPHVHVESPDGWAVFDLAPMRLRDYERYTRREVRQLYEIVLNHREEFLRQWREFFDR